MPRIGEIILMVVLSLCFLKITQFSFAQDLNSCLPSQRLLGSQRFSTPKRFIIMDNLHKVSLWLAVSVLLWTGTFQAFGQRFPGFVAGGRPVVQNAHTDQPATVTFTPNRRGEAFWAVVEDVVYPGVDVMQPVDYGTVNYGSSYQHRLELVETVRSASPQTISSGNWPLFGYGSQDTVAGTPVTFEIANLPGGDYRLFLVVKRRGNCFTCYGALKNKDLVAHVPPSLIDGGVVVDFNTSDEDSFFTFTADLPGTYHWAVGRPNSSSLTPTQIYLENTGVLSRGSGAITPGTAQTISVPLVATDRYRSVTFYLVLVPRDDFLTSNGNVDEMCAFYTSASFVVEETTQEITVAPSVTAGDNTEESVVTFTPGGNVDSTYHWVVTPVSCIAMDDPRGRAIVGETVIGCAGSSSSYTTNSVETFEIPALAVGDYRLHLAQSSFFSPSDAATTEHVDFTVVPSELAALEELLAEVRAELGVAQSEIAAQQTEIAAQQAEIAAQQAEIAAQQAEIDRLQDALWAGNILLLSPNPIPADITTLTVVTNRAGTLSVFQQMSSTSTIEIARHAAFAGENIISFDHPQGVFFVRMAWDDGTMLTRRVVRQ